MGNSTLQASKDLYEESSGPENTSGNTQPTPTTAPSNTKTTPSGPIDCKTAFDLLKQQMTVAVVTQEKGPMKLACIVRANAHSKAIEWNVHWEASEQAMTLHAVQFYDGHTVTAQAKPGIDKFIASENQIATPAKWKVAEGNRLQLDSSLVFRGMDRFKYVHEMKTFMENNKKIFLGGFGKAAAVFNAAPLPSNNLAPAPAPAPAPEPAPAPVRGPDQLPDASRMAHDAEEAEEHKIPEEAKSMFIAFNKLVVKFDKASLVGSGGFGKVYRGSYSGTPVAIKVLNDGIDDETFWKETLRHRSLVHPSLLCVIGVSKDPSNRLLLITEYCENNNLSDALENPQLQARLTLAKRKQIAIEIAQGMWFLHSKDLLHNDLKPQNVMMTKELRVRIGDFGLAKPVKPARGVTVAMPEFTPEFCAPERTLHSQVSKPSDVFSFAMVLHQLFTGKSPFDGMELSANAHLRALQIAQNEAIRPPLPDSLPAGLAELIRDCWRADPAARPTFLQAEERLKAIETDAL